MNNSTLSPEQMAKLSELKASLAERKSTPSSGSSRPAPAGRPTPKAPPPIVRRRILNPEISQLSDRIATLNEGIEYKHSGRFWPAPMDNLDQFLFDLAVYRGANPQRLALGLPRVPNGVSTWLALCSMVAHVVMSRDADPRGLSEPWIVIATRERSVRDLYLSQRLRFNNRIVRAQEFPIYRLRRDGGAQLISESRCTDGSMPVLFWHFDTAPIGSVHLISGRATLALVELSEYDSRQSPVLLDRLRDFETRLSIPKILLFFNSFDDNARDALEQSGYEITHLRPRVRGTDCSTPSVIPTSSNTFCSFALKQDISVEVVDHDNGVSQRLSELARCIGRLGGQIESPNAKRVVAGWWTIWRTIKDLVVPLQEYERARIGRGMSTLEVAIARATRRANFVEGPDGEKLQAASKDILKSLNALYDSLENPVPKADVFSRVLDALETTTPVVVALNDRAQLDVLTEKALFGEIRRGVEFRDWKEMSRIGDRVGKAILPGAWAPWHDAPIVAAGAQTVSVIIYACESSTLKTRLEQHLVESSSLFDRLESAKPLPPIFELPKEELAKLNRAMKTEAPLDGQPGDAEAALTEPFEEEEAEAPLTEAEAVGDQGSAEYVSVFFDDGTARFFGAHSEMMLLTDDGIEVIFANYLSPGDRIAVMPEASSRSIFESILSRVNHLVGADQQVIALWRQALHTVSEKYPLRDRQLHRALRRLGCTRVEQTMRNWFTGTTMAPNDRADISRILQLAGHPKPDAVARLVAKEVESVRTFNRRLGRRIQKQIRAAAAQASQPDQRIDFEIDEAIESLEYKKIVRVLRSGGD